MTPPISLARVRLVDAGCNGKYWLAKEAYQFCGQLLTNRDWGCGTARSFRDQHANASARWQMARTWNDGSRRVSYFINKNLTPSFTPSNPGGHTISGNVLVQHSMGDHFHAQLGYQRLHQSYSGIAAITALLKPIARSSRSPISFQDHWEDNYGRNLRGTKFGRA